MNKLIAGYIGKAKDFKPINFIIKGQIKLNETKENEVKTNETK